MAEANRVRALYDQTVIPAMIKKFNYKNVNQVPKLVKITINSGLGDIKDNSKSVQLAQKELEQISGQKPVLTQAKKSVANFKLRQGMKIGAKVTLRGDAKDTNFLVGAEGGYGVIENPFFNEDQAPDKCYQNYLVGKVLHP